MTTAIVVSVLVPIAAAAILLAVRNRLPRLAADVRGIALQTVIVMVVLLAIAGAVAAVLLSRGSEAISEVEESEHHDREPLHRLRAILHEMLASAGTPQFTAVRVAGQAFQ